MGNLLARLWQAAFGAAECKIVFVGLDNAGKTTIVYRLSLGQVVATTPTIGSNVEEFTHGNVKFLVWDVGGQESLRDTWTTYYANARVCSPSLLRRLHTAAFTTPRAHTGARVCGRQHRPRAHRRGPRPVPHRARRRGLSPATTAQHCTWGRAQHSRGMRWGGWEQQLKDAAVLVFANKQDARGAMSAAEISQRFALHTLKDHEWHIEPCCALTGQGLEAGIDWLAQRLRPSRG